MLLGTLTLSLVGGIGAALTVGLRKGGILLSLLILPFYIPVLVFGTAAVDAAALGADYLPHLAILGAFALIGAHAGAARCRRRAAHQPGPLKKIPARGRD